MWGNTTLYRNMQCKQNQESLRENSYLHSRCKPEQTVIKAVGNVYIAPISWWGLPKNKVRVLRWKWIVRLNQIWPLYQGSPYSHSAFTKPIQNKIKQSQQQCHIFMKVCRHQAGNAAIQNWLVRSNPKNWKASKFSIICCRIVLFAV